MEYKRLREEVLYDQISGEFRWVNLGRRKSLVAGRIDKDGYRRIWIDRKECYAHQIAWTLMTGIWPRIDVDHKDGNRSNNAWCNLRLATRSQNVANAFVVSKNKSGYKGVHWSKVCGKWKAEITCQGKKIYLGIFDDPAVAYQCYCEAATKLFGGFARVS